MISANFSLIKQFKSDIEKYLNSNDDDNLNKLNDELEEIIDQFEFNEIDAIESWNNLQCSKFSSFQEYLNFIDPNRLENTNTTSSRIKIMRAERKKPICFKCNKELTTIDPDVMICEQCGYSENIKNSVPNTRINNINCKHVLKQLDSICGTKKIPAKLEKLKEYILLWLTDLHFIYEWLLYSNNLNNFIKKYEKVKLFKISDPDTFFNNIIERIPENRIGFRLFKIFIDEFYMLLEFCKKRYSKNISNLTCKSDEIKLNVIKEYLKNNSEIPKSNDTFEYNGSVYEIGLYFVELSIWYKHPDNSIFYKILELFRSKNPAISEKDFKVPGLMFNFPEVYKLSENVPKKYSYGQEYIYFNNYIFNVQYVSISNQDRKELENLIFDFNRFYKEVNLKRTATDKVNSPLFSCTLICIIENIPRFNKYKPILEYLPDKALINSTTKSYINSVWYKYIFSNPQILEKYKEEKQEEETDNLFIL